MAVGHTHDDRLVVFFDIDNTLYSSSTKIAEAMGVKIRTYIVSIGLSDTDEDASRLQSHYYTQYGLTLRGLRHNHSIDPLDFDKKCDGAVPLEEMLFPDSRVQKLLEDIDRSKCRVWALTNAFWTHAERVLEILKLRDQFEGVVYCDYSEKDDIVCKPQSAFYHRAMHQAGVRDPNKCPFVDDSINNVEAARGVGWTRSVHFQECGPETAEVLRVNHTTKNQEKIVTKDGIPIISNLHQLRVVWPDIFAKAEH